MVQFHASLEALVLQAWRERWSELEWSINLKSVLTDDSSEINKLCGLLLKQATLSEEPNKLMFGYLNYSVAAQVVSHTSLLDAVVNYKTFQKELCIETILETLSLIRDRLNCNNADWYQCQKLCSLIKQLFSWFLSGIEYTLNHQSRVLLSELVTSVIGFSYNAFIALCLYFEYLENTTEVSRLVDDADWISDHCKGDFRNFAQRISNVKSLLTNTHSLFVAARREPSANATVISVAILYGSVLLAEPLESVVSAIKNVQEIQKLTWCHVIRDFIRGSLLLQQDSCLSVPESHMTAFVYLRVPRVLKQLNEEGVLSKEILIDALTQLSHFHSLFNALDMRSKCDCFQFFLSELVKLNLINNAETTHLMQLRKVEKTGLSDSSPGSQASISLVLKAEPTLQTLLKSFHSEFAQKQDKLVQMMHHMISGKSFEFICAAAAATGRLSTFSGKLVEFNEVSKTNTTGDEKPEELVLRGELFDLSFLLLSRIVQLYTCRPIRLCKSNSGSFFESWCFRYIEPSGNYINSNSNDDETSSAAAAATSTAITSFGDSSNDAPTTTTIDDCQDMWLKLKTNQPGWLSNELRDWSAICRHVPKLGQIFLNEIKDDRISIEECKNVFTGLLWVNVNGAQWMCSLLLCLAQWLVTSPLGDERKKVATALNSFIDSAVAPVGGERNKLTDRQTFMANVTKRLLSPLLAQNPVPVPPYPWLSSVRRSSQPPITTQFVGTPSVDFIRQHFTLALRQGWLMSSALGAVERCEQLNEHKIWMKVWMDELHKLSSVEELNLWNDLCIACCYINSPSILLSFIDTIATFVFEQGRELFCVAPRGTMLSKFLVQLYMLAFRLMIKNDAPTIADEPKAKIRKMETSSSSLPVSEESRILFTSRQDQSMSSDNDEQTLLNSLASLYRKFSQVTENGDIRPAIFFVASFLRCLADYTTTEAKSMINALPSNLIGLVIRTDPQILSAPTIMALYDLNERNSRQRALQNLCLLRQLKAL